MEHVVESDGYAKPAFGRPGIPKWKCSCGFEYTSGGTLEAQQNQIIHCPPHKK